MDFRSILILAALVLALAIPDFAGAQPWPPQPGPPPGYPPPHGRGPDRDSREERRREQEMRKQERKWEQQWRKEERRREREYRNWYNDYWRGHNRRYFGGYILQPYPNESYDSYVSRVRQRCNVEWSRCATRCNQIRDARARAACVASCNNELYGCNSAF